MRVANGADYMPTWGRLSEWLHATNPFAAMRSPEAGAQFGLAVAQKLVTLLNHHSVRLSERNELLVCMMSDATTGRVHASSFGSAAVGRAPNTSDRPRQVRDSNQHMFSH